MWAVIPRLQRQPDVAMFPDAPELVEMAGGFINPFGFVATEYAFTGDATLTCLVPNVCAVHTLIRFIPNSVVVLKIGNSYALRLFDVSYGGDAQNWPVGGDGKLLYPVAFPHFGLSKYPKAELLCDNQQLAFTLLPKVGYANSISGVGVSGISGIAVCFGYAYSGTGQLQAYAHISVHRVSRDQQAQINTVPSCGSGTASMLVDIDPELAFDGPFTVTGSSGVQFRHMACRIGPFPISTAHVQDTLQTRVARAGTRVASLRSSATNFSQPLAFGGQFINAARGNQQGMATVDCGAHNEFVNSSRFAVSLAGQPDADTAYVPASRNWQSNCGFTAAQVQKMSSLTVQLNNLTFPKNLPGSSSNPHSFSLSFGTLQSLDLGNNEYVAFVNNPSADIERLHIWLSIVGLEDVADYQATPLSAVQVSHRFQVLISVYGEGEAWFNATQKRIGRVDLSQNLTESEAIDLFNGDPVTVQSTVTITASG